MLKGKYYAYLQKCADKCSFGFSAFFISGIIRIKKEMNWYDFKAVKISFVTHFSFTFFIYSFVIIENATIEDIKGFLSEITLMKSVVQHRHIVGIVGHSTKLFNKMMLLTEYCSEGNLLDYLRYCESVLFGREISNSRIMNIDDFL